MKATVIECVIGVFGFGEADEMIEQVFFPKNPLKIAEKLGKIEQGKIIEELLLLVEKLQEKGYTTFSFENAELSRNVREKLQIEVVVETVSKAGEFLRQNLETIAVNARFVNNPEEVRELIHEATIEMAKIKVKRAIEKRDLLIVQAANTIGDLDKILNLLMSRLREWYSLHFPELSRLIDKHETYARLVANLERRENFTTKKLENEGLQQRKAKQIARGAEESMGADLRKEDLDQIQVICKRTLELYNLRQSIEKYVDKVMEEVAPNIKSLVGPLLGARFIALSGGLLNLAKLPSSTVQVLGAEKALFRALRTGTRPPKHGILFQHSLIHGAKRWQRGKTARALAGKLSIAARIDAFSGKFRGESLKAALEKRIKEIKEKHKEPPPPKVKERKERRRKKRER